MDTPDSVETVREGGLASTIIETVSLQIRLIIFFIYMFRRILMNLKNLVLMGFLTEESCPTLL